MNDLISVIVPVYNVESYLEQCIDSILAQTYKNLEIILVDDGSTDRSGEICDRYAEQDSRIRVVHQANGGVSSARNSGLQICRGNYLGFVDSDDYIDRDMYRILLDNLLREDADISACDMYSVFSDYIQAWKNGGKKYYFSGKEAAKGLFNLGEIFHEGIKFAACNKLYRRKVFFPENGERITFPKGRLYEDFCVILAVTYRANHIVYSGENLYYYRQRAGSTTHTFDRRTVLERRRQILYLYKWIETEAPDLRTYAEPYALRLFNILINEYFQYKLYPFWINDLNQFNHEIVRNTKVIFSNKIATRKDIKIYLFMKFGLFIQQKRIRYFVNRLKSRFYKGVKVNNKIIQK